MDCREGLLYLAGRYFEIVARASRRDLAEASEFFAMPMGQASYAIGNLDPARLRVVGGYGLPYIVANQSLLLAYGAAEKATTNYAPAVIDQLTGWRRQAFDLAVDHWWTARTWAREDIGVAATLLGLRSLDEGKNLSALPESSIRPLAAASYNRMTMDPSLGLQSAVLLAEADAAPDRITVARCSSPLLAA